VIPTGHNAKSTVTPTIGLLARLSGVLHLKGIGATKISVLATLACLLALALPGVAGAALIHQYLPPPSEELGKGVPAGAGCGETPPLAEPTPCLTGALTAARALAVSGEDVWVLDRSPSATGQSGGFRVDRFDGKTGAFVGPQLDEEGAASDLNKNVAVGHAFSSEQVYVDAGHAIAVFDGETGKLAHVWAGNTALPPGELRGTAVDDAPSISGDPDVGDVYVSTKGQTPAENVVRVLDPEESGLTKAGEEPAKVVAELTGTCESTNEIVGASGCEVGAGEVPFTQPYGVVVSPVNGDVLVTDGYEPFVVDVFAPQAMGQYEFVRQLTGTPYGPFGRSEGVAVDGGNGEIYVADNGLVPIEPVNGLGKFVRKSPEAVDQFNEKGEFLGRLTGTPAGAFTGESNGKLNLEGVVLNGVAVAPTGSGSAGGDVYVGDSSEQANVGPVDVFGPDLVVPDVTTSAATVVHATHVQLNGTVKLDGAGSAACVFEYGTSTSYGSEAPCEDPATVTEAEEVPPGTPVAVKATIKGLLPDTTYFYRVSATNSGGFPSRESTEDKGEVTTTGPGLHGVFASEVASTAATLGATINPRSLPTSYYFQYVDPAGEGVASTAACPPTGSAKCPTLPATPEALGSAPGDQTVTQRLQGLSPSHEYHYRVVVVSEPPGEPAETFAEADKTFTTQPPASGFALPDGRQWELVTPPDKHGATPRERSNGVTQASVSGDAITYQTTKPIEEGAPGYGDVVEQVLSVRGKGGWESQDISAPHGEPSENSAGEGQEYRTFSEDLSSALVEPFGEFTSLKPDVFPPDTERTPYLRHDLTCVSIPSTCYEPLLTEAPGYADVPAGTHFGVPGGGALKGGWEVKAATPELTHVILGEFAAGSQTPLKDGAPSQSLYEWSASAPLGEGQLQLVSVLPDGTPTSGIISQTGGQARGNDARAVSEDGARVVWTQEGGEGGLYLTDMSLGRSVRLDVPEAECLAKKECGGGQVTPIFQTMDNGGSRVFFSDRQQLLSGAGTGENLYECAIVVEAGAPRCELHDVAPGAGLLGETIVGASEDGNYVYFVSNNAVGDGVGHGAVNGNCNGDTTKSEWQRATPVTACNLYMVHYAGAAGWEPPALVGVLSGDDAPAWAIFEKKPARVSPDGRWLAFMSNRSLTGYDNRDAHSGKPDEEVFLYHAGSGSQPPGLVCASCDPTGARPTGFEVGFPYLSRLATSEEWTEEAWLAGAIPGWTGYDLGTSLYQSRYLSDSGRLFFNSSDALVPQDINNQVDVYEFEPANTAAEPPPNDSCTTGSSTYNSATGGCVDLISSGTSHQESGFYDASASGDDVFFLTNESLVAQDPGGARSIYDAHVCGAEGVPCTQTAAVPPQCTTADACRAAPAPQPGIFGAPSSATFSGPGNLAGGLESNPVKKVTKKTLKCKRGFVKSKHNKCIRNKSKHKAKKSAHTNRRAK
jgi:hypothetical protein